MTLERGFRWMRARRMRTFASAAALALASGCGPRADADEVARADAADAKETLECRITHPELSLGTRVPEASGAALDRRTRGLFWTHGDSGNDPILFAVGVNGQLLGRVRLTGARNRDWEDMAIGPCPGGTCVYVADIGNNQARPLDLVLYRAPAPAATDSATAPAEAFHARFPGNGRDAEAIFVMPDGEVYIVTKGRTEPVELWHWPTPLRAGPAVDLERVREIAPRPTQLGDYVTGAGASRNGRWVAIRTYGRLALYRAADLLAGGGRPYTLELAALGETWGEGVAIDDDGTVLLVSEGSGHHTGSAAAWLRCALPAT
ncbi:hypothetical protein [Longimicrobium sp.]|uniref:hypothetical protein n=1 Tax=Longimicrobium sp. TaxID=2029185 RepID=UPI002E30DEC8|nr:hypothetical protein [Longimicrobium sp.]HEX6042228.1 hypothetical protein [Longimicrobium sp.]